MSDCIGKLDTLCTVEAPVTSRAADGGVTRAWVPVAARWASIEALRGAERTASGKRQATGDYLITMRHYSALVPEMRVTVGSVIYRLSAAYDPDNKARYTEAIATIEHGSVEGTTLDVLLTNEDGDYIYTDEGNHITVGVAA